MKCRRQTEEAREPGKRVVQNALKRHQGKITAALGLGLAGHFYELMEKLGLTRGAEQF
jgi:hypothetical protein